MVVATAARDEWLGRRERERERARAGRGRRRTTEGGVALVVRGGFGRVPNGHSVRKRKTKAMVDDGKKVVGWVRSEVAG